MTVRDDCKLCLEHKDLQRSHILPDAIFRRIKQQTSGKVISLKDDRNSLVHYSQESWWERLLCGACEGTIQNYETYGFQLLRGAPSVGAKKHASGITFQNHNFQKFKLFLTSLIWRAAVSRQPEFSKVIVPDLLLEEARNSLLEGQPLAPLRLGCKISRLYDSTPQEAGGFCQDTLKQLLISPIPRLYGKRGHYGILMVFEGFVFEFFLPGVPNKRRNERGIHRKSKTLAVPFIEVTSVTEVFNLLVHAYGKADRGLVAFES